mmetsp:Transcript_85038/g.134344  ORF Transcript_85038/g.134344 Transcript_85038/m.134344 type:complete len:330 (+) Transcript_85038:40-1029(+)
MYDEDGRGSLSPASRTDQRHSGEEHLPLSIASFPLPSSTENLIVEVLTMKGETIQTLSVPGTMLGISFAEAVLQQHPPARSTCVRIAVGDVMLQRSKSLAEQGIETGSKVTYVVCEVSEMDQHIVRKKVEQGLDVTDDDMDIWDTIEHLTLSAWLTDVALPRKLLCLIFDRDFNQSIEGVVLPSTLQSLTFGDSFNQSMKMVTLPSGLKNLAFGRDFDQSIENVALPQSLESLTFGYHFNYDCRFNQSMKNVVLPSSLERLTFGHDFNQSLIDLALPSGLQSLTLGFCFKRGLEGVVLPSGLQNLTFCRWLDESIENLVLPEGCKLRTW